MYNIDSAVQNVKFFLVILYYCTAVLDISNAIYDNFVYVYIS